MNAISPGAWDLDNRMTVVLFAGMGGGCDGLEQAGFHVHLAVNHDPIAVAVHQKRHPHTKHLRTDVFEVDPVEATQGRGVRMMHASPDCTHFSVAKGSKPVSKRRRSLAWVICRWMGKVRPEVVTLENVWEITTWSPLIAKRDPATGRVLKLDGSVAAKGERVPVQEQQLVPDPKKRGQIWRAFVRHIRERLGYSFEFKKLCCADYGVPTIRTRLFGVAKADGSPIDWPSRTHAPRGKAKAMGLKPWVGADTILDWSLPVRSIFGRKKDLAPATMRRTAHGFVRHVLQAEKAYIVPITHTQGANAARAASQPMPTITTAKGGEQMVAVPHIAKFRTGAKGADVLDPLPTFTANSFEKRPGGAVPLGVVAAHLTKFNQNGVGSDPQEPLDTLVAQAPRHAVVSASLIQSGYGEREGQAPRALDLKEPAGTQVAGGSKAALVAAFLAQNNTGEPGRRAEDPLSTIVAKGSTQGVVALSLQRQFGNSVGADIADPAPTVTVGGSGKTALVAATLGNMHGSNVSGRPVDEPLATLSAGGSHAHLILGFLQHYFGSGKQDDDVRSPLGALTAKARYGLVEVMVDKVAHYVDDIGIRMLEPEEGAAAHGFAKGSLPSEIEVDGKVRRLTKTQKYHLVGNSVPPEMVRLLAELNGHRELMVAAE